LTRSSVIAVTFEAFLTMKDVAKRVNVTLPDTVYADLERWAELRDQAIATVAAIAIELAIRDVKDRGELPPASRQEGDLDDG
jgi:hypothetical protein